MPKFVPIIIKVSGEKDAEKAAQQITTAFKQIDKEADSSARSASSSFSEHLSAEFFGNLAKDAFRSFVQDAKQYITESITLAQDLQNALLGVSSIAAFKGINPTEAQEAINNLALVKNGIIGVADASVALKNLLQSGFGLKESITLIERFGDTAAFGKQAALTYGEAIRSATEGIKNQNSILVDNAGITKNLEVLLKERGFHLQDLSDKLKGVAAREALYNGLLAESQGQLGDAAKLTDTYTGSIAAQDKAYQDLQRSLGDIIITNPALIESNKIVAEQLGETTKAIQDQNSESAKFVRDSVGYYASIKAQIAPFGAFVLNAAKSVFHGLGVLNEGFWGTFNYVIDGVINALSKAIAAIYNLLAAGINKITDTAKKLPTDVTGGPLFVLQNLGRLEPLTNLPALDRSSQNSRELYRHLDGLTNAIDGMRKASEEGVEVRRRLNNEVADAEFMRNLNRSLGVNPSAGDARVMRANELADAVATGTEKGTAKAAKDLFKLSGQLPVPTSGNAAIDTKIREVAQKYGLDERLAFAQIFQESQFNRFAVSPKGARGLAQFMPGTGRQYGLNAKADFSNVDKSLEAYGSHMSDLLARYGGNVELALIAYNWGPSNADRIIANYQKGKGIRLPGETRGYVADITRFGPFGKGVDRNEALGLNLLKEFSNQPLSTTFTPAQSVEARQTEDQKYIASLRESLGLNRDITTEVLRRRNIQAEINADAEANRNSTKELEEDIRSLRAHNADAEFVESRRILSLRTEERNLLQDIEFLKDDIANSPYLDSLRTERALLQDIYDIRQRDVDAVISQNRSQLELQDATVVHTEQVRAAVLEHLASQRTMTEAWGDGIISVYDQVANAADRGIEKLTRRVAIIDDLLKSVVRQLLNRVFQKFLDVILPSGSSSGQVSVGRGGGSFLGGLFGNVFRPGSGTFNTGGFAGGAGAGQYLSLAGLAGGLGVPTSASAQIAQQSAISSAIHEAGHSATAGTALGAATSSSLLPTLGGILPFIGLSAGSTLGGRSTTGQILGSAGGLIAGGIGAAYLAPGLFAAGGIFGASGPAIAALLTNPITAIAAGALLVGSLILSRNSARRRDEETRNQAMIDSLGQLDQIIAAVKANQMDGTQALAAAMQIRQNYVTSMSALKDSKTRGIALKDVYRLDLKIDQIKTASAAAQKARDFSSQFIPTFATGGVFNSDFFIPRAARGLVEIPGAFDQQDDLLMRVSRGERVAVMTPQQYSRIGGRRTFEAAGVPALSTGGSSNDSSNSSTSGSREDIVIKPRGGLEETLLRALFDGMRTEDGRRLIVAAVDQDHRKNGMAGNLGTIANGLTRRT